MEPVRIKYWGLMRITRPTYVVLQSLALCFCLVLMAVGFLGILSTGAVLPHLPDPDDGADFFKQLLVLTFWVGLLTLIAESAEMYVMLRKFARAEAEQRAKLLSLLEAESAPAAPSSTAVQSSPNVPPPNTNIQP